MTPRHSVRVITPPVAEPVTLAEAKAQVRADHGADDALLARWVRLARETVEAESGRRLMTQTAEVTFDRFPCGAEPLALPVAPVQSMSGVSYQRATDGAAAALTGFQAWLSHDPPLLAPAAGQSWPATLSGALAPVTVTCVCGAGTPAAVPGEAVQAILLTVGYWHGFRGDGRDPHREESIPGEAGLPAGAVRLIDLLRRRAYR